MQTQCAPPILLVEDNDAHAYLILTFLQEQPLVDRIDRVADGEEALDYLFRRGPYENASSLPALVLLDLRLPKFDGLEVLRQIKASCELRDIPVVILSTSEDEADVMAAYSLHANGYLVKPLGAAQFAGMSEALVTYWLGWNYPPQKHPPAGETASLSQRS